MPACMCHGGVASDGIYWCMVLGDEIVPPHAQKPIHYLCNSVHCGWPHDGVIGCVVPRCAAAKDSDGAGRIHSQVMRSCQLQHALDAMRVDLHQQGDPVIRRCRDHTSADCVICDMLPAHCIISHPDCSMQRLCKGDAQQDWAGKAAGSRQLPVNTTHLERQRRVALPNGCKTAV
jgi:hypothetical protein